MEKSLRSVSLWLFLDYRFPEAYGHTEAAREARVTLADGISRLLTGRGTLSPDGAQSSVAKRAQSQAAKRGKSCFACGLEGHMSRDCPSRGGGGADGASVGGGRAAGASSARGGGRGGGSGGGGRGGTASGRGRARGPHGGGEGTKPELLGCRVYVPFPPTLG